MDQDNQVENNSHDKNHQAENKSTKNRISKIGTAIKSAAEYGLFEGVGKTIKNFATGAATGAKQGYGYFNNDISKKLNNELAKLEAIVNDQMQKANENLPSNKEQYIDLSQDESYKKLGFKEKLDLLAGVIDDTAKANQKNPTNDKSLANTEINEKLDKLEEIVKTQFEILNASLQKSEQYPDLSQDKEYIALNPKEKIAHLIGLSQHAFIEMGNELSEWPSQFGEAHKLSQSLKKMYDEKVPHATDEITKRSDLENKTHESKAQFLIKSLNEMYDKSREGRKIEQYKSVLNNQLNTLANNVSIINELEYKAAQTYEEKINLIKNKSQQLQQSMTSENLSTKPNSVTNQGQINSDSITNTVRLFTMAEETFASLKAAEEQLLNPKQSRVVRTLKTAAGVMAGATIGALKGSGSAIKTGGKAMLNAPTGIQETYRRNRRTGTQNTR